MRGVRIPAALPPTARWSQPETTACCAGGDLPGPEDFDEEGFLDGDGWRSDVPRNPL